MPALTITWRDESYGYHSGAYHAFRTYHSDELSTDDRLRLHVAASNAGFEWDGRRATWVSYNGDAHRALVRNLIDQAFDIAHAGRFGPEAFA